MMSAPGLDAGTALAFGKIALEPGGARRPLIRSSEAGTQFLAKVLDARCERSAALRF
jgi:hypothetical protein